MAFVVGEPQDTTKIRNVGTVIRPNWLAIEEGDSTFRPEAFNLQNRTPLGAANDPTTIAETSILYVKDDVSAVPLPETYLKDGAGNIIKWTEAGSLGSITTQVNTNGLTFDIDSITGLTYVDGQMVTAYGQFNSSGALLFGKNMSTSGSPHPSAGTFNIDVSADVLNNANYIVSGSVQASLGASSSVRAVMVRTAPTPVASTVTTIQVEVRRDGGTTDTFTNFNVMICGGR